MLMPIELCETDHKRASYFCTANSPYYEIKQGQIYPKDKREFYYIEVLSDAVDWHSPDTEDVRVPSGTYEFVKTEKGTKVVKTS